MNPKSMCIRKCCIKSQTQQKNVFQPLFCINFLRFKTLIADSTRVFESAIPLWVDSLQLLSINFHHAMLFLESAKYIFNSL